MRKLNMWQRLGVVVSVLWILGGGFWQRSSDIGEASRIYDINYRACVDNAARDVQNFDLTSCFNEAGKELTTFLDQAWPNVAIAAFVPVVLGWLGAYLVLWICRWVLAGRRVSD